MNVAAVAEPGRRQEPPVWVVGPQIFMPSSASFACSVARIWIGNGVSGSRISAKQDSSAGLSYLHHNTGSLIDILV